MNKISLTIDSAAAIIISWITSRRRYFWHIDGVRLKFNVFYNKNKIIQNKFFGNSLILKTSELNN